MSKNTFKKHCFINRRKRQKVLFLLKISIHLFMIILYIVEESIFVAIIYNCLKVNGKQIIKMPEEGEYVKFNNYEIKTKTNC